MNLRKNTWKYVKLSKVMSFKNGFNFNKGNLENGWKVLGVSDFQDFFYPNYESLETLISDKLPSSDYLVEDNDILFVRSNGNKDLVGRTLLIKEPPFPITFSAFCIRGRFVDSTIDPLFFAFYSKSEAFKTAIKILVQGTNITSISQGLLSQLEIPVPPLEEQKQMAVLFQSIDSAIGEMEAQQRNLKALQQRMANGLLKRIPEFGNLLSGDNCMAASFGELVECDERYPEHGKEVERFVGLENLEPENFKIQGFGVLSSGTTFTKRFVEGDVLFGKRRAYLKKVAVANFDGVCSNDILVLRTKGKKMLQGLLPYYLISDQFIQHAISTSAGSISPRTKWKDLSSFNISIPKSKAQTKILQIFEQLQKALELFKTQRRTILNLRQKLLNEIQ